MANNVFFAVLTATLILLVQQGDGRQCCIGGKIINGACLPPCSKVCPHVNLPCQPFLEGTNDPDSWTAAQNIPCFQYEEDQVTGKSFLRTSCKCPDRDYTDDSLNPPTLSNCILSTIETEENIYMGQMFQVQLGLMYADDRDINFEEDVSNSRICILDSDNVYFQNFIEFKFNTVHSMLVDDNIVFEDDTTIGPGNRFTIVTAGGDLIFNENSKVFGNQWGIMSIDGCTIDTTAFIKNNRCDSAAIGDPSECPAPVAGGFKCIPEPE